MARGLPDLSRPAALRRCLAGLAFALALAAAPLRAADLIGFWDQPRHGGNSFNRLPPDQAYLDALRAYGASWVRLAYDKWKPEGRDFLVGDADHYEALSQPDLATLRATLERVRRAGLKAVIVPLTLPGMRWAQNNGDRFDGRLWTDRAWWEQAARFWRDLATALKDEPAVAAYNIVNEPAPEKGAGLAEHAGAAAMAAWYGAQRGGPRDLPAFYETVIRAIRSVDATTPIMVDAGWYAAADAFAYWPARLADDRVLYSVHMYEPYAATSAPNLKRAKPFAYPGPVPYAGGTATWDAARVAAYLQLPLGWARAHGVPAEHLVVGEFGCARRLPFCTRYREDVLTALDAARPHWAFYAFREDSWDGMDYELGSGKVDWHYWEAVDAGAPDPVKRHATPEFEPIRKRLAGG
ncbi:MAG: cellulase family glycosylhydrolase [Dongiaceae bacterium]